MEQNEGEAHRIHRPYILRNPQPMDVSVPFEEDIEAWLTKLEVYAPFGDDRKRALDRWRGVTDKERGDAFYSVLSVVAAMQGHLRPKPPLAVRFPKPCRQHVGAATEPCKRYVMYVPTEGWTCDARRACMAVTASQNGDNPKYR
jgi:hypothetical protein